MGLKSNMLPVALVWHHIFGYKHQKTIMMFLTYKLGHMQHIFCVPDENITITGYGTTWGSINNDIIIAQNDANTLVNFN